MIPNSIGPIVVAATLTIGTAIALEATLSFLGFGIRPADAGTRRPARRGSGAGPRQVVARHLPGSPDRAHRPLHQLHRRRAPRRPRSHPAPRAVPEPLRPLDPGPRRRVLDGGRRRPGGRRDQLRPLSRRDARNRRRVGLRQERQHDVDPRADSAAARARSFAARRSSREAICSRSRRRSSGTSAATRSRSSSRIR